MFLIYVLTFVSVIFSVAFYTVVERKILAGIQRRVGPEYFTPYFNFLQGFFDGLKLLESTSIPRRVNTFNFLTAPIGLFSVNICSWFLIPMFSDLLVINVESPILLLFSVLALSPFFILLAGISSKNNYAYMGSLRAMSSMLSYELVLSFILLILSFVSGGFSFEDIQAFQELNNHFVVYAPLLASFFIIFTLAETNRAPFDLAEAESELVAGFHVEYSGFLFALFFLAEYGFMLLYANLFVIFFVGGWGLSTSWIAKILYVLKVLFVLALFIIIRASFPRFRIDALLIFSWRKVLPFLCNYLLIIFIFSIKSFEMNSCILC